MIDRCKLEHEENNVITVTNNNVEYYENLAKQSAEDSKKFAEESKFYSKKAIDYTNSHTSSNSNPHNVTAEQVGAYSKSEIQTMFAEGLAGKNPNLVSGTNIVITDNDDGTQTISSSNIVSLDYSISENKPSINSVSLVGNKTSHDLGLASVTDIPINVSELQNDSGYLIPQDITGKQDILSAGDGIAINNNVIATINRLDTDLSNISSIGKKVIDGQWVTKTQILSTAKTSGEFTIDLSEYLPNDNCIYEILLVHDSDSKDTGTANAEIKSDIITDYVYISHADSTGTRYSTNNFTLPAKNSLTWKHSQSYRLCTLCAYAYRRIGTNV